MKKKILILGVILALVMALVIPASVALAKITTEVGLVVNEAWTITVEAPSDITLTPVRQGQTATGFSETAGLVETNADIWSVTAIGRDDGGHMTFGVGGTLTEPFQIGKVDGTYTDADPGITYTQDDVGGTSLPFYVSQVTTTADGAYTYSIVINFTASVGG